MKPEAHAFPTISATFHLTHACNLRCDYCYTGEKFGIGMTAATARDAVTFAHQLACEARAQHLEIVFFGGEPLLKHDLLCSIVDQVRVRAKGMRVSFKMSTNGLLLSPRVIADLAAGVSESLCRSASTVIRPPRMPSGLTRKAEAAPQSSSMSSLVCWLGIRTPL